MKLEVEDRLHTRSIFLLCVCLLRFFGRDVEGKRATNGGNPKLDHDPHFRDYVWFYEVRQRLDVLP